MKFIILIVTATLSQQVLAQKRYDTTQAPMGTCAGLEECIQGCLDSAKEEAPTTMDNNTATIVEVSECGEGEWRQIAHLNMSYSNEKCPTEWKEYSTPVRACGRKDIYTSLCYSKFYSTGGHRYSKVCGRALGYRYGYTDGFNAPPAAVHSPDDNYVEGLSITHGTNPRTHIWTFAAGNSELYNSFLGSCPCAGGNGVRPPSFVGENYHCESGYSGQFDPGVVFLTQDVLWDGMRCEGRCCKKSPPWFSVSLEASTSDDVEVRICGLQTDGEDTPIKLLEIYIQ